MEKVNFDYERFIRSAPGYVKISIFDNCSKRVTMNGNGNSGPPPRGRGNKLSAVVSNTKVRSTEPVNQGGREPGFTQPLNGKGKSGTQPDNDITPAKAEAKAEADRGDGEIMVDSSGNTSSLKESAGVSNTSESTETVNQEDILSQPVKACGSMSGLGKSGALPDHGVMTCKEETKEEEKKAALPKDPALPEAFKHTPAKLRRVLVELLRIYQKRRRGEKCEFNVGEWMQSCLDRNPWCNVLETTEEEVEQAKRIFREASSSSVFDRQCEIAEMGRKEKECGWGGRDIRSKAKFTKVKAEVGESEIWKEAQKCKVEVRAVEEEFKFSGQSGTEVPVTFSADKKLVPGLKLGGQDKMQLEGKMWQGKDWKEAHVKVVVKEEREKKVKKEQPAKGWGALFKWPKGQTQQFPKKVKEPKEKDNLKVTEVKREKKVKKVKKVKLGDKIPEEEEGGEGKLGDKIPEEVESGEEKLGDKIPEEKEGGGGKLGDKISEEEEGGEVKRSEETGDKISEEKKKIGEEGGAMDIVDTLLTELVSAAVKESKEKIKKVSNEGGKKTRKQMKVNDGKTWLKKIFKIMKKSANNGRFKTKTRRTRNTKVSSGPPTKVIKPPSFKHRGCPEARNFAQLANEGRTTKKPEVSKKAEREEEVKKGEATLGDRIPEEVKRGEETLGDRIPEEVKRGEETLGDRIPEEVKIDKEVNSTRSTGWVIPPCAGLKGGAPSQVRNI